MKRFTTGVLLETADGSIVLQQRDEKPGLFDSGRVSTFGGQGEPGETPVETAIREVAEETEISLLARDLTLLARFEQGPSCADRRDHYIYLARGVDAGKVVVHEGAGAVTVRRTDDLTKVNLAPFARYILSMYWGV